MVANLEPRTLRGEASQGLILSAAEGPTKARMIVLSPSAEVVVGSIVA